ncbi:MAG: hypothetical protein ACTSQE_13715 [Candidatus Heimdallarchaeaceae archaeon]
MEYYQLAKITSATVLVFVACITIYIGRRNQSPYYLNWVLFALSYSVYEFSLFLEYTYQGVILYQLVQTTRAITITILLGSCLQQSRMLPRKSTIFFASSVMLFMLYIIWVPLAIEKTVETFRDVEVIIFNFLHTDIFGLIFGILVIVSAIFLLPIFLNLIERLRNSYNKKKIAKKAALTMFTIALITLLGVIIMLRRAQMIQGSSGFKYFESIASFIIVVYVSIYQSQSLSHGIQAVLVVDREGNPIIGYSPLRREKISFEEKIIAASGFLSSLFLFVKNYVASSKDEEFKELKTTSSSLLFYAGKKFFLIVQTSLASTILDQVSSNVLNEIDFYLSDLNVNEMPSITQINDLYMLLDRSFSNMA